MDQHDAILSRLLTLHPKKIDLSLGRTERLLAALGRPELRLPPIIHVAGTNGKGSTIAFLRAMLEAAGKRVHVYTSPHLLRFNERIRLGGDGGGTLVDDERLNAALERCEQANARAADHLLRDHDGRGLLALRRSAGRLAAARDGPRRAL